MEIAVKVRGTNQELKVTGFYDNTVFVDLPPQRTWVGLTTTDQKEIQRLSVYVEGAIRMTEAKLKEKNT